MWYREFLSYIASFQFVRWRIENSANLISDLTSYLCWIQFSAKFYFPIFLYMRRQITLESMFENGQIQRVLFSLRWLSLALGFGFCKVLVIVFLVVVVHGSFLYCFVSLHMLFFVFRTCFSVDDFDKQFYFDLQKIFQEPLLTNKILTIVLKIERDEDTDRKMWMLWWGGTLNCCSRKAFVALLTNGLDYY